MATERLIGIDFGTSTSVVRVKRYKDGKSVDDRMETKPVTFNMGSTMVPTLIRKTENGTYYGYNAEINKRNSTLYQSFKVYLENDDPQKREKARSLTAEFIKYLAQAYREQSDGGHLGEPSDVERTLISYPVKWSDETKEFMLSAAREAGLPNVSGMNEAEAAIRAVMLQNGDLIRKKGYCVEGQSINILLLDMGAGTSDLVLGQYTAGAHPKIKVLCTYPKTGDILFGGREVDMLLGQYVTERVPEENRDGILKRIGMEKYKAWKETVVSPELKKSNTIEEFAELETVMEYCDFEASLSLNREVFEGFSCDYITKFTKLVKGCLNEACVSGSDIDLVILTGGHSKWYFVNDILCGKTTKFGDCGLTKLKQDNDRVISIALPQETVALGLVYSGAAHTSHLSDNNKNNDSGKESSKDTGNDNGKESRKDIGNDIGKDSVNDSRNNSGSGGSSKVKKEKVDAEDIPSDAYLHQLRRIYELDKLSFAEVEKLAKESNGEALIAIGKKYEEGLGVTPSYTQAQYYYDKACECGIGLGYCRLADLYLAGRGVTQNTLTAKDYFEKAIKCKCPEGYFGLGVIAEDFDCNFAVAEKQYKCFTDYFERQSVKLSDSKENDDAVQGFYRAVIRIYNRNNLKKITTQGFCNIFGITNSINNVPSNFSDGIGEIKKLDEDFPGAYFFRGEMDWGGKKNFIALSIHGIHTLNNGVTTNFVGWQSFVNSKLDCEYYSTLSFKYNVFCAVEGKKYFIMPYVSVDNKEGLMHKLIQLQNEVRKQLAIED